MNGTCEARITGICEGRAQHRHHRKLRRHGDHSATNLISVCFRCHEHIHRNPRWAISYGLIIPSWDDPELIQHIAHAKPQQIGPIGTDEGEEA